MLIDWNVILAMVYGNVWIISALTFLMLLGLAVAFRMSVSQLFIAMIATVLILAIRFSNPTLNIIAYFAIVFILMLAIYKLVVR